MKMWEILVPEASPNQEWVDKIISIAGGATIGSCNIGWWVNDDSEPILDNITPVKILCTEAKIKEIAEYTREYYDQICVMYYLLSKQTFLVYKS